MEQLAQEHYSPRAEVSVIMFPLRGHIDQATQELELFQMQRNEREARTLCEILDWAIKGEILKLIMVGLGRLKAIETVVEPGTGGWNVARHHEMIPRPQAGLLTSRDRENVAGDVRDEARVQGQLRGGQPLRSPPGPRPPAPRRRDQDGAGR